jgi:hypothetical protein
MDLLWIIAIIALVIGAVLLLAGYLIREVPPDAVRAGWGLLILGIVLVLIVVLVDEADHAGSDRGLMLGVLPMLLYGWKNRPRRC